MIVIMLILLSACKEAQVEIDYEYSKLDIICPTGAPALAFVNEIDNENFETNSNPSIIVSSMNENGNRVVVIDTITGIKAINNGAPYKLACSITFGNFYLVSTGNDDNNSFDRDDRIVLFGKDTTPDKIFHFIYGNDFVNEEYVASVQDAGKCLAMGKNLQTGSTVDYVLLAEPILTNIMANKDAPTYLKSSIYSYLKDEYEKLTGKKMIQASVFLKNDDYIADKIDYLNYLEININNVLNNNEEVMKKLNNYSLEEVSTKFGIGVPIINNVLSANSIGLGFMRAYEHKEDIDYFINLFDMEKTNEEIYVK